MTNYNRNFASSSLKIPLTTPANNVVGLQNLLDACSGKFRRSYTCNHDSGEHIYSKNKGEKDGRWLENGRYYSDLTTKVSGDGISTTARTQCHDLTAAGKRNGRDITMDEKSKRAEESFHSGDTNRQYEHIDRCPENETEAKGTGTLLQEDEDTYNRHHDILPVLSTSDTVIYDYKHQYDVPTCPHCKFEYDNYPHCVQRHGVSNCPHCMLSHTINDQPVVHIIGTYTNPVLDPNTVSMLQCISTSVLDPKDKCNGSNPELKTEKTVKEEFVGNRSHETLETTQINHRKDQNSLGKSNESTNKDCVKTSLDSQINMSLFSPLNTAPSPHNHSLSSTFSQASDCEQKQSVHSEINVSKSAAKTEPSSSSIRQLDYFEELVQIFVQVLFRMEKKASNETCDRDNAVCKDISDILLEPCEQTKTIKNVKKTKEKTSLSSRFEKGWNPEQCETNVTPLLPVKYNAPVTWSGLASSSASSGVGVEGDSTQKPANSSWRQLPEDLKQSMLSHVPGLKISPPLMDKKKARISQKRRSHGGLKAKSQSDQREISNIDKAANKTTLIPKKGIKPAERNLISLPNSNVKYKTYKELKGKSEHHRSWHSQDNSDELCAWSDSSIYRNNEMSLGGEIDVGIPRDETPFYTTKHDYCSCYMNQTRPPSVTSQDKELDHKNKATKARTAVECKECKQTKDNKSRKIKQFDSYMFPKRSYGRDNLLIDDHDQTENEKQISRGNLPSDSVNELMRTGSLNEDVNCTKKCLNTIELCSLDTVENVDAITEITMSETCSRDTVEKVDAVTEITMFETCSRDTVENVDAVTEITLSETCSLHTVENVDVVTEIALSETAEDSQHDNEIIRNVHGGTRSVIITYPEVTVSGQEVCMESDPVPITELNPEMTGPPSMSVSAADDGHLEHSHWFSDNVCPVQGEGVLVICAENPSGSQTDLSCNNKRWHAQFTQEHPTNNSEILDQCISENILKDTATLNVLCNADYSDRQHGIASKHIDFGFDITKTCNEEESVFQENHVNSRMKISVGNNTDEESCRNSKIFRKYSTQPILVKDFHVKKDPNKLPCSQEELLKYRKLQNEQGGVSYESAEPTFTGEQMRFPSSNNESLHLRVTEPAACSPQLTQRTHKQCISSRNTERRKTIPTSSKKFISTTSPCFGAGSKHAKFSESPHLQILPSTVDSTREAATVFRPVLVGSAIKQQEMVNLSGLTTSKGIDVTGPAKEYLNQKPKFQDPLKASIRDENEWALLSGLKERVHAKHDNDRKKQVLYSEGSYIKNFVGKHGHTESNGRSVCMYHMNARDPWLNNWELRRPFVTSFQDIPLDFSRKKYLPADVGLTSHKYDMFLEELIHSNNCDFSLIFPEQEHPLNLSTKSVW